MLLLCGCCAAAGAVATTLEVLCRNGDALAKKFLLRGGLLSDCRIAESYRSTVCIST